MNVLNFPERPRLKGTDVSPWYGFYLLSERVAQRQNSCISAARGQSFAHLDWTISETPVQEMTSKA